MDYIRHRREQIGINQQELADRLQSRGFNVTRGTIGHWEQDRHKPPMYDPRFVKVLADVLETDVVTMLLNLGYEIELQHSEEGEQAAQMVDKMTPEQRDMAVRILEQMTTKAGK